MNSSNSSKSSRYLNVKYVSNKVILDWKNARCIFNVLNIGTFVITRCTCHTCCTVALLFGTDFRRHQGYYPTSILGGKYPITSVRDLTTGYDNTKPGNKAILPVSKSSQMITFTFKNGLVTTLRSSGTEPKLKYYNELCASPDQKDLKELRNILDEMVSAIVEEFLQPQANKLIARSA